MAIAAYRKVLAAEGQAGGPSQNEMAMAAAKLREAEESERAHTVSVSRLQRKGAQLRPLEWYAEQIDELSEELFSESASLYAECGVALLDGLRELARHVRARRLLAAAQVLRGVEKQITKAVAMGSQRDEQERAWLTTARALLNELRSRAAEVQTALRELEDNEALGTAGWRPAGEAAGVRAEWKADTADGSLWLKVDGEITGAPLLRAAAAAREASLWTRWLPLCSVAEVVAPLGLMEQLLWVQFELPMLKRGSLLHWTFADCSLERQSFLLLAASVDEDSLESGGAARPAAAHGVPSADFRAVKVLVAPISATRARVRFVMNVDLGKSVPQTILDVLTKKMATGLAALQREARRDGESGEPLQPKIDGDPELYGAVRSLLQNYFDLYGES